MIKLSGQSNDTEIYEHNFTWNGASVQGTILVPHNKGRIPDFIEVYTFQSGVWSHHPELYSAGGESYGYFSGNQPGTDENTEDIYFYKNTSQTSLPARIRLYFFIGTPKFDLS